MNDTNYFHESIITCFKLKAGYDTFMKIIRIIQSVLAAFFGVQNNDKFKQDDKFIEENGVGYFLIIGFILVFLLLSLLFLFVSFIVD